MSMTLADADRHCMRMVRHYENFTVASRLTPRRLRRDLVRVYAFARTTDDIGDETGDAAAATAALQQWREMVAALFTSAPSQSTPPRSAVGPQPAPDHPVLLALHDTVRRRALDVRPFLDLIDANLQDQRVQRYEDWASLREYCELSAAPVGRIVLRLSGAWSERAQSLSDDVCIGLQLANFAQDVSVDREKGRTYLVQQDIARLGDVGAIRAMSYEAARLLRSGRELEALVRGRLRLQLALYRAGGEAILASIAALGYDTRHTRPVVSATARARVLAHACSATLFPARGRFQRVVMPHG